MAVSTIKRPLSRDFKVTRNKTYTYSLTSDAAVLVGGKYGAAAFLSIVYTNGGTPYVKDLASTGYVTAEVVPGTTTLRFKMGSYADGRAFPLFQSSDVGYFTES